MVVLLAVLVVLAVAVAVIVFRLLSGVWPLGPECHGDVCTGWLS